MEDLFRWLEKIDGVDWVREGGDVRCAGTRGFGKGQIGSVLRME